MSLKNIFQRAVPYLVPLIVSALSDLVRKLAEDSSSPPPPPIKQRRRAGSASKSHPVTPPEATKTAFVSTSTLEKPSQQVTLSLSSDTDLADMGNGMRP